MIVAFVSTYPPAECGIGTYTQNLAEELKFQGHSVYIFAELLKDQIASVSEVVGNVRVIRCWRRDAPLDSPRGIGRLGTLIKATQADVAHVQHEFGIFPDSAAFLQAFAGIECPKAITLHSVLPSPYRAGFFRRLNPKHAIVHGREAQAVLGGGSVILHGTHLKDAEADRAKLRLPDYPTVVGLVPGMLHEGKGIHEIVEAMARSSPSTFYAFVGKQSPTLRLTSLLREYDLDARSIEVDKFLPKEERLDYFRAADFVILGGGRDSPYSASGNLAEAIGCGVPVLAKNIPIYLDKAEGVIHYRKGILAHLLRKFSKNSVLLYSLGVANYNEAAERTWEKTAKKHIQFYQSQIDRSFQPVEEKP